MNPFTTPSKTLVALSLAIGLGGCSGLPGLFAGTGLGLTGQAAIDAGAALTADALAAVNADEDLDRATAVAQAASYTTQSLDASAGAETSAGTSTGTSTGTSAEASAEASATTGAGGTEATTSLEAQFGVGSGLALRIERLQSRFAGQVETLKKYADIEAPITVTNSDSTVTTTYEITIARPFNTTHMTATTTLGLDGKVILMTYDAQKSNKTGHSMTVHRERKVNLDGTWTGVFESKLTRKDGKAKTVKWTVVGALDGSETAEGTITRFDGSVVTIAISRSADGTVVVVTRDATARIAAEAKKTELATTAEVKVVSDADGKTLETVKIADTTEVEASDR